ncbi:MAG: C4-type Zn-finger protein [Candidatus Methanohalarchaeum thermophilum]|uniref:C4-type Zn-finger protein n=1 Tax=Methanohalarchaeum thermophilum TaxID=1903181 RepID=A0A1Q6DXU9_METT1|nr:MAG: C4-type Zn-finger protein [Candidatus Methanohalarchaeum thermophilum]
MEETSGREKIEIKVEEKKDLEILVKRSETAAIRIPGYGIEIEPGPGSKTSKFRIRDILDNLANVIERFGEDNKRKRDLLELISDVKEGKDNIRVVIEDPEEDSNVISRPC